jgi:4-aminobutyrate aminotransferase-like enzyme
MQIMDFTAGLNGYNLGQNHPGVLTAVANQMEKYARSGGYFDNTNTIFQLKRLLSGILPSILDSFFYQYRRRGSEICALVGTDHNEARCGYSDYL